MINAQVIQERLGRLAQYVERLREYETLTFEQFQESRDAELVTERLLQVSTQIVIDVSTHILAAGANKRPQDYG
jgi:uncharacterized protein YutE (UPF0331/DUF86 family)